MGLAFGVVSGFGPVAGIYSAVCTGLFAALFGGTATQISGPTGPIAIVMASVTITFAGQPGAIMGIIMLAGVLQLLFGALRFGRYISLLPFPVTSGFASAVGCIIIVMQLNPLIGQPPAIDTLSTVTSLADYAGEINGATIAIAIGCLAACRLTPLRLRSAIPVHLSVLIGASALVALFGLDVPMLAAPESLLPSPQWPPLAELPWSEMWLAALILALISSLDSLLTSLAADTATQSFHDSDRELVGQGLGNFFAGILGVLPGAGSTFRTMANIRGGGKTTLSAVFHSIALLGLLLATGNFIRFIPASVLAGILIYIGLGIVDWRYIRRFLVVPRTGVVIMVTTWMVALFVNVVTGAALGIFMASLAFVKRMADLQLDALDVSGGESSGSNLLSDSERLALDAAEGRTMLIRLGGPLAFGAANGLSKRIANLAGYEALVIDFSDVPDIDESGIIAFENIVRAARTNGKAVLIAGLRRRVVRPILRFGLIDVLKSCSRFRRRIDALRAAARIVQHAEEETTEEN